MTGQEAMVIIYAAAGSGHDRYFYRHQAAMVAGAVAPPKLELANQDLIKSHIYSVWLGLSLFYHSQNSKIVRNYHKCYPESDCERFYC